MQHLLEFDDKKFANASKENLKLGDKDEEERKEFKELKKDMKPLTEWWKNLLGGCPVPGPVPGCSTGVDVCAVTNESSKLEGSSCCE